MQQSNSKAKIYYATDTGLRYSKKDRAKIAFIYVRISREDDLEAESYSIQNQIKLLTQLAQEYGYTVLIIFMDDGITGVISKRPGFQDMLAKLEQGYASALFVKDLSRLYRNRTEADKLIDDFLPEHEIRLVSVGDSIDTAEGDDEFIFLRNWANEQYARDISKKRRLSNRVRGNAGEPLSPPPYGYTKAPDNPKRWIVDEEAAAVVRRVYSMTLDGYGTEQIAAALSADKILTPMFYWRSKGVKRPGKVTDRIPHKWNSSSVVKILSLQEYCGDVINFKTYSKSFKHKERLPNSEENWAVFKDVHDPIIDRGIWEQVQQKRGKVRKRVTNEGEKNMFSGLLRCADCGKNLWYHFNQKNPEIRYFNCSNYKGNRGTCTSTHYVRVDFLEQVVLGEVRRLTQFASRYENDFVKAAIGQSQQNIVTEREALRRELKDLQKRDAELDNLFERIYEDNVSGKLTDERFSKMSAKYEAEQAEIAGRVKTLQMEIDKETDKSMSTDMFISKVRKYTRAKKLTQRMLNELVDYIEVYQAEKIDGVHVQKLKIHYNCVGSIEIPNVLPLSQPEVLIQTRKGVALSYSQSQKIVNL
ncbi:recombinase family protein [[Clostridium] symbiosum]|uniref:recombinase family protein n=1 Tax=Clostridium symbiosum TaxID=1512 RepID=UPI002ED654DF